MNMCKKHSNPGSRRRKPKYRILGVDFSLTCTGVAFPDGNTAIVEPPMDMRGMERVEWIVDSFKGILALSQPTHVCMEGYAMLRGGYGTFETAEAVGCLKLLFFQQGLPTILVPPKTLKKFITGNGNATKNQMMAALKKVWGVSFVSSDRADAYALRAFAMEKLVPGAVSRGNQQSLGKAKMLDCKRLQEAETDVDNDL